MSKVWTFKISTNTQAFLDAFPQLSPTQVGETFSFSENPLSFSEYFMSFPEKKYFIKYFKK